jgi:hypothetical protein
MCGGESGAIEGLALSLPNRPFERAGMTGLRPIVASFLVLALYCTPLRAHGTALDSWRIVRVERFKVHIQHLGDVDRAAVVFGNGTRLEIPLFRAQPIAVLRGTDGTYFLLARGADCTQCDENIDSGSMLWVGRC